MGFPVVWSGYFSISGDGTVAVQGEYVRFSLDTIPPGVLAYNSPGGFFRGVGRFDLRSGGIVGEFSAVNFADQAFGPYADYYDTLTYSLAPGVSGKLRFGRLRP